MSPAELRRLAERKLVESGAMAADADRLRAEAAALRGLLEPLVTISREVWSGPAAAEFEADVVRHGSRLDEECGRVIRIAAELDERARLLRLDATSLREQASVAEAAAGAGAFPLPGGVA